jgi:hypothetical protein
MCLIGIKILAIPVVPFVPNCVKNVQKTRLFTFFERLFRKKVKKVDNKINEKKNYAHKILNQTSKFEKYGHKE